VYEALYRIGRETAQAGRFSSEFDGESRFLLPFVSKNAYLAVDLFDQTRHTVIR
jgi:hypothetical protein